MKRSLLRGLLLALLCAVIAGASASTGLAKASKPARVSGSFDFVYVNECFPTPGVTGHVELLAYDDDTNPVVNSWDRQNDRVSMTVTWDDGATWTPDVLGVEVRSNGDVFVADTSWYWGFTIRDGGNPGSRETGELDQGFPVTLDSMRYDGVSLCGSDGSFYLTSGNLRIAPAS